MTQPLKELLTVAEVAKILGCSPANVYALIEKGELPYIRTGSSKGYRVHPDDLASFIQSRRVQNEGEKTKAPRPQLKHLRI